MKDYQEILLTCPLFRNIDPADLPGMLACLGARVDFFDRKYTIFAEGIPARYVGIVLSGRVQIERTDYRGNRDLIGMAGPGEMFGESFAAAGESHLPLSVVAAEESRIMLIDCRRILHPCENHCHFHQQLIFNLMQDIARKSVLFHRRLQILSCRTTREKLLTYLSLTAKEQGSREFVIPFDRQALADYLQVERSGLSAQIGQLVREGVLTTHKNHFCLLRIPEED